MSDTEIFCRMVRERSSEHRRAVVSLHLSTAFGQIISVLRQELDSMIRVIFLLSIEDREQRRKLIEASVEGRQWTHEGTKKRITEREMVELASKLQGWTRSVYSFGCAFVHLSSFHDYRERDPMTMISDDERRAILDHMQYYHGGPCGPTVSFQDMLPYLPMIFDKIASNLECYVASLESDGDLTT
ncbi:MAG: hypothetical protein K8S55_03895 [Phycisphaerae bacterium]|nr:hypothetical protein [Phycisphaerae bacterium]